MAEAWSQPTCRPQNRQKEDEVGQRLTDFRKTRMKLIYIDTETTGIECPESGLIQLAGVIEIGGEVKMSFDYRIRPFSTDTISDEALAVNGVTRQDLEDYADPQAVFRGFIDLLSEYVDRYDRTDKFHLVGYNAGFDADHLRAWFTKNNDQYFGSWFWHPPVDVMGIASLVLMRQRPAIKNFRLATVARTLGLEVDSEKTHDALYDVELTRQMFYVMLDHVTMEEPFLPPGTQ
jgi:DNA polymerase-3 subunit epsilon